MINIHKIIVTLAQTLRRVSASLQTVIWDRQKRVFLNPGAKILPIPPLPLNTNWQVESGGGGGVLPDQILSCFNPLQHFVSIEIGGSSSVRSCQENSRTRGKAP